MPEQPQVPPVLGEMLELLREAGFPPLMVGALKHACKGIDPDQAREMCLRVGIGMCNIYNGGSVRDSLSTDVLTDDSAVQQMLTALRSSTAEVPPVVSPEQMFPTTSGSGEQLFLPDVVGE